MVGAKTRLISICFDSVCNRKREELHAVERRDIAKVENIDDFGDLSHNHVIVRVHQMLYTKQNHWPQRQY